MAHCRYNTPQIDFENAQHEYVDKTSWKGDVHYFKRNVTDLFNISDYNNIDEHQHSSCSGNESNTGNNESEADEVPTKKRKRENNSKWSAENQNQNWKDVQLVMLRREHQGQDVMLVLSKMSWRCFYYT